MKQIKYTDEYLQEICKEKDIVYISVDTILYHKKQRRILNFICQKHISKGIQTRPIEKIISNKKPCQYCNHSKLKETFKEEISLINPDIEILSDYVNWDTKIRCRCKNDGYEWDGRASVLLYGGGCKICGHRKRWDSRGRKTTDDFIKEMISINDNIKIIGQYNGSHTPIKCQCLIDNCIWESYPCNLLNQSASCPECNKRHMRELEALSNDEFITRLSEANENIEALDIYTNANTNIRFKCKIHNCEFTTSPKTFLYKGGKGCPYCNQSSGEKKMVKILEQKGFKVKQQYTFGDCKNIHKLRFDAYDIENNILYEYQGQQHYYPIDFAGKGDIWAKEQYDIGIKRDNIKIKYCREKEIPLIIVPYWEFDNMEEFLDREISRYIA